MGRADAELKLLMELTALPTAAGREGRVLAYVENWAKRRKDVHVRSDRYGNRYLQQAGRRRKAPAPVYLTAHLDHPAFVVREVRERALVELEFRGGVSDACFPGKEVEIFDSTDRRHFGSIVELRKSEPFRVVRVKLRGSGAGLDTGDIGRWRLRGPGARPAVSRGIFRAPACDDLAGVAAALAVFDRLRRRPECGHVRVLLTRAEEVGLVGAYAAAASEEIPADARLICLETSRSFAESPIGGGPILRVGDKASVFSPELTNRLTVILAEYEKRRAGFRWQRRLMPGGVCEATVFSELGYQATCACLALGNYHNMTDASLPPGAVSTGGIGPEYISIDDYFGLIEMLCVCIEGLNGKGDMLRARLRGRFEGARHVLDETL